MGKGHYRPLRGPATARQALTPSTHNEIGKQSPWEGTNSIFLLSKITCSPCSKEIGSHDLEPCTWVLVPFTDMPRG